VFDLYGDIQPEGLGEEGVYHDGTRYLSRLILRLGKERPLFLSSTVRESNDLLTVDLTNPDAYVRDHLVIPRGTVHVSRTKFLWQGRCYERLLIKNFGLADLATTVSLCYSADFADIFEVRGTKRARRGRYLEDEVNGDEVVIGYEGLDGMARRTRLTFTPRPTTLTSSEARFQVRLPPKGEAVIFLTACCGGASGVPALTFDDALTAAARAAGQAREGGCTIRTSNDRFNAWLGRAAADLQVMTTQTADGPYPYAGVPWFSTVFGRDGILTALQCLWIDPGMARGVLSCLAATQATEVIPEQDAEPGKILHESRRGEMAALGEIPFGRYYGSVDSTPLFVMLAGAYLERTADVAFIRSLWANVERALKWIDTYGDPDGDGFVDYLRQSSNGLTQQGWKDSHDSVFHADGTLVKGPVALCEVQGYAYAAKRRAAEMAAALGLSERGKELHQQAEELRKRFDEAFWCEEIGTYALALDGDKRPCRVRASNAGHCLFTGIAAPERARAVAQTLMSEAFFSGWGVRTLATSEVRYNPMSYHNGSVWPHDNALIAAGLSLYGQKHAAMRILGGLYDASCFLDLHRMPELFCGFARRPDEGPTLYPVACSPQAWAAAAVYALLQACLGVQVRDAEARVCFSHPVLPPWLREVQIHGLRVGRTGAVDVLLQRHARDVGVNVLRKDGDAEVSVVM
jgi:glycogen debranching enzyme